MTVNHHTDIKLKPVGMKRAVNTKVRWLIGAAQRVADFAMRIFEIEPGGHSPRH